MFIRVDVLHASVSLLDNFPQWQNQLRLYRLKVNYIQAVLLLCAGTANYMLCIFQCGAILSQSNMTGAKSILSSFKQSAAF